MSEDLKQLSALTALNSMMEKDYFDICTIDKVAALLDIQPKGSDAYRILSPLHCVHWAKMPPQLRDAVPGLIQEVLGIAPVFQFTTTQPEVRVIEVRPVHERPERRGILRLLGMS